MPVVLEESIAESKEDRDVKDSIVVVNNVKISGTNVDMSDPVDVERYVRRLAYALASIESGHDYSADAAGSSASGAYQFTDDTWAQYAKEAGLRSIPSRAKFAPTSDQDFVAYFKIRGWLNQYGPEKILVFLPLKWIHPVTAAKYIAGNTSVLNQVVPGNNNGITFGEYVNRFLRAMGANITSAYRPKYDFKVLPICMETSGVPVEDVQQIERMLHVPEKFRSPKGKFGTVLKLYIMDFQKKNNFKITGCFGEEEANALSAEDPNELSADSLEEGADDTDGDDNEPSLSSSFNIPHTPGVDVVHLVPTFAANLYQFIQAAKRQGYSIIVFSGFRSKEHQARLWANALKKYGSPAAARRWVAPPGRSMHGRGLAADLEYSSGAARRWAHANAARFNLVYPLSHEPWHIELRGARK